jgi:ubiquinone/menaquinone biosynthesis C-methylase UbiE
MYSPATQIATDAASFPATKHSLPSRTPPVSLFASINRMVSKRWDRERRRRQVGRAFDMAIEVARLVPQRSQVLDVGCGNGYIAHHLSALMGKNVVGIDVGERTAAPISYLRYDGAHFPARDKSVDVVLFCYVLHHTRDALKVLSEARRVLRRAGLVIVYEDIPGTLWDRVVCATHDRQWRPRTGPCTFRRSREWRDVFAQAGFQVAMERPLSRWRNLSHPVSRSFYLLTRTDA